MSGVEEAVERVRRFRPYPEYKDSGDGWLVRLPTTWDSAKIIRYARLKTGGTPDRENPNYWQDGTINWLASGEVNKGVIREVDRRITKEGMRYSNASILPVDSVLIALNGQGRTKATAAILKVAATCNQSLAAFICDESRLNPTYLFYYLRSRYGDIRGLVGEQRDGLSLGLLKQIPVYLPSVHEQRAIAEFLDRETGKIDALVAKKERLIELLQEKRSALITHAVTKGLDPTAPTKPSGIDWLGDIPAHWCLVPLSPVIRRITYGFTNPMPTTDDGPFMLTANDIGDGEILYSTARRTTQEAFDRDLTDKSRPRDGDILITKDGTLGRVAVADGTPLCINQSVALLRIDESKASIDFVQNALRASAYQDRMVFEAGGTTIKHIYVSRLVKMPLAFPPVDEQERICRYVAARREALDQLISRVRGGISRLTEFRTAIISVAVTGKIDVREEVPYVE